MSGSKRVATAFILSCAIYLTPLVGPHAVFFLGEVLWRDLDHALRGGGDRDLAWIATDLGVALLTQLVLLLLLHRLLRRPGLFRKLCIGLSVVSAVVVLNYAYMSAIPSRFLLQPDTALERDMWPLQCAAHKVWIPQIASAPTLLRGAPIWVAEVYPPNRYGLFEAANCAVTPLSLAQSAAGYVTYVAGTHALCLSAPPPTAHQSWFVFDAASGTKTPLGQGLVDQGQFPILSTDGGSVAWLRPVAGATPPTQLEAVVRRVGAGDAAVVNLSAIAMGGIVQLVQLDTKARELIVARGLSELFWIGFDGRVRRTLPKPALVEPQPQTFRLVADGWVAWDAYRDNEPYRVAWSFPSGKGNLRVPKGRSITSLAVSPDARWIAVSVTSGISIGSTPDAVFVIRAADGAEVFRKYLPKYTRSSVAFPDSGRFVYTNLEGVNVLKIQ
jgi:hypothetical protein